MINTKSLAIIIFSILVFFTNVKAVSDTKFVVKKNRLESIYEGDQLIYVSTSNIGLDTLNYLPNELNFNIDETITSVENDKKISLENLKSENYKYSYLLLFYIIGIFIAVILFKNNNISIFSFSYKNNQISDIGLFGVTIASCILASTFYGFESINKIFIYFLMYFVFVFIIVQFTEFYLSKIGLLKYKFILIFKVLSVVFCLFIFAKLFHYSNMIFPINETMFITLIILLSVVLSMLMLLKQYRNTSLSYIFYYLCAFEILPAFILKAIVL